MLRKPWLQWLLGLSLEFSKQRVLARGMKHGMTINSLKCIADLNVEADFEVNGAIDMIVTNSGILFYSDNGPFSFIIQFF